jgi:hypothetical protein
MFLLLSIPWTITEKLSYITLGVWTITEKLSCISLGVWTITEK